MSWRYHSRVYRVYWYIAIRRYLRALATATSPCTCVGEEGALLGYAVQNVQALERG